VTSRPVSVTEQDVLTWVEQIAAAISGYYGVEMLTARVLGWLMICDPPQQSAQQIAGTLAEHGVRHELSAVPHRGRILAHGRTAG